MTISIPRKNDSVTLRNAIEYMCGHFSVKVFDVVVWVIDHMFRWFLLRTFTPAQVSYIFSGYWDCEGVGRIFIVECYLYTLTLMVLTDKELSLCMDNYQESIDFMRNSKNCGNEENRVKAIELWTSQINRFKREVFRRSFS